ncbi:MAG: IgGFc-binding protein, partial [Candidatus Kapaibacterium sp.]
MILCSILTGILLNSGENVSAQSFITSTISKASGNNTSGYGRDNWFAIPQNYIGSAQKYFTVYVNSLQPTTVNFQITGGPKVQKPVTAGKTAIFSSPSPKKPGGDISLTTELSTSGIVEQKAIHVWSDDADIAVYLLSRRDYSSDGMYVIPTTGWGKEYIVGAYESIFDPTGGADWPSEFAIVSSQDNTLVSITPSWDIRKAGFPSVIDHAKNQTFSVSLNKGECIQYQTVLPINDGECDLTGTVITSNKPVGVTGGSVCPYIPFPDGYCDFVVDMLQPVRTWSKTYFTAPFAGRKYGGDVYLVVATKAQIIYRNGTAAAVLNKYGDHLFIYDDVAASPPAVWTSTAPFELIQYVPSATFGSPNQTTRNQGDPAMVVINGADGFRKNISLQIPMIDIASGQTEFTNHVNILLPAGHEAQTTYDGIPLSTGSFPSNVLQFERLSIPGTPWEAIRLTYKANLGEGSHTIHSDTGIGAYVYGYGTDDSYAWNADLGVATIGSPDTLPPIAVMSGTCFDLHAALSDSRKDDSKLSSFVVDTLYNMS